jgi:hypothetical protein
LTIAANTPTPWAMNIPQTDTTIEHRCEALTISEIPPYPLHHFGNRRPARP